MIGKTDFELHPPEIARSYVLDDAEVSLFKQGLHLSVAQDQHVSDVAAHDGR